MNSLSGVVFSSFLAAQPIPNPHLSNPWASEMREIKETPYQWRMVATLKMFPLALYRRTDRRALVLWI